MKERGWWGLHTSIWKIASTHVVVDAYNNIYAPMLPLLIPQLGLSLSTAGILAMCFQMANSVSQLGVRRARRSLAAARAGHRRPARRGDRA